MVNQGHTEKDHPVWKDQYFLNVVVVKKEIVIGKDDDQGVGVGVEAEV